MGWFVHLPKDPRKEEKGDIVEWLVSVGVDTYGGNYEREMAAYIFGASWEGYYDDYAEAGGWMYEDYEPTSVPEGMEWSQDTILWFVTDSEHAPETGYPAGCTGWNDNWYVCFLFEVRPTTEQLKLIRKRAEDFRSVVIDDSRPRFSFPTEIKSVVLGNFVGDSYRYVEEV